LEKDACVYDQAGMTGNGGKIANERKYKLLHVKLLFQILALTYEQFSADIL